MRFFTHISLGKNKTAEGTFESINNAVVSPLVMLAQFAWLLVFLMLLINIFIEVFGCKILS